MELKRKIPFYQAANMTDKESKKNFIVRQKEYNRIISEIRKDDMTGSIQHYLIIGRRGSGKSTLLRRLEAEIKTDDSLSDKIIVVNLSEEQAGVYRFFDLWDYVIRALKIKYTISEIPDWDNFEDMTEYSKALYFVIQKVLKREKRKLVLLIDNIDRIFENIGDDARLLRELLTNYNDLRIIGGSTRLSEHHWKYEAPFYQFFKAIRLKALTTNEIGELLEYWGNVLQRPEIHGFLKRYPGKIEAIRQLTDGMPRTLLHFIELLIDQPEQNGFEYLRQIIDLATPIYQERLQELSPGQRKVLLELSFFWDAAKVNQLTEKCKMPGKTVSAFLKQLVDMGVIDKIKGLKKNMLYRVSERFFNLWLLMTQGGPREKNNVKCFTVFLEAWYEKEELQHVISSHINHLCTSKIKDDHAVFMSKALLHSKYITVEQRDDLIENTLNTLNDNREYYGYMPERSNTIYEKAGQSILNGKYQEARDLLKQIDQDDRKKDNLLGISFAREKKLDKAIEFFERASIKGYEDSIYNLAVVYEELGRTEDARKNYLKAVLNGNAGAMNNLAILYKDEGDYEEAEKYYNMSMEKGFIQAITNLAILYEDLDRITEAEKLYLRAVEEGDARAMNNLAVIYEEQNRITEAERYYLQAIEYDDSDAMINLALLYKNQKRFEEAEKYYLLAAEKDDYKAMNDLADLYYNLERKVEAEEYYLMAVDRGYRKAMFNLALMYYDQNVQHEKAVGLLKKSLEEFSDFITEAAYAILLLWANKIEEFKERINQVKIMLLEEEDEDHIEGLKINIVELLVHKQYNLVWQWFNDPEYGEKLKNMVKPLYYIAIEFVSEKENKEELLKAGPELQESISSIKEYIKEKQEFYYS